MQIAADLRVGGLGIGETATTDRVLIGSTDKQIISDEADERLLVLVHEQVPQVSCRGRDIPHKYPPCVGRGP